MARGRIPELGVSVNVSANQFQNKYFMEEVQNALADFGVRGEIFAFGINGERHAQSDNMKPLAQCGLLGALGCENFN